MKSVKKMLDWWIDLPFSKQLLTLFVLGLALGVIHRVWLWL